MPSQASTGDIDHVPSLFALVTRHCGHGTRKHTYLSGLGAKKKINKSISARKAGVRGQETGIMEGARPVSGVGGGRVGPRPGAGRGANARTRGTFGAEMRRAEATIIQLLCGVYEGDGASSFFPPPLLIPHDTSVLSEIAVPCDTECIVIETQRQRYPYDSNKISNNNIDL